MTQGVITSLPPLIQQPPGNASANPAGLPGVTYTAAVPTLPQTWTGLQTFQPGTMQFAGSISGNTFLNASPIASGIADLPALTGTDILLANNNTAVVTNKSIDGTTNTLTNINAANISSGTLPAGRLPNPSAATLGGIQSAVAVSHQWINSISTSGVPALSQPTFADISGSVAATQLPNPSATTLGGIESLAAVGSKWINTISTSGVPTATQPAFTDISGSVAASQMPALTGDVTTIAGTVATTIAANAVTNAKMATMGAFTFKANNTSGAATPTDITIDGLTLKASPAAGDEVIIWDVAGAALKKATVSGVGASSGVASIDVQTGAFTTGNGIDSSGKVIELTAARRTLPTVQKFTTGSGTYTTPANVLWIRVRLIGGGGGGGGAGTGTATAATAGTASTFGTTLLSAGGGGRGADLTNAAGSAGAASLGTGPIGLALSGATPGAVMPTGTSIAVAGGGGGNGAFGGGGIPQAGGAGVGQTNTGGGGAGGASTASTAIPGGGGGSGAFVDAVITSPSATYAYVVGAAGAGGSNTANGFGGAAGGSGFIIVEEFYGT
jgi:hypothetical protein